MTNYEIMFIVKANADEKAIEKTAENLKKVITDNKGEITDSKDLGNKELAYPIKKELTGYYFVVDFKGTASLVDELDRKARIDESILRHLIINVDEEM